MASYEATFHQALAYATFVSQQVGGRSQVLVVLDSFLYFEDRNIKTEF
jgi:hypothetical protein